MINKKSKLIAYVGPFSFPNGGAAARRILGISQSLLAANYDVIIGSGQCEGEGPENGQYNGINVCSLNERTAENFPIFVKHIVYFWMGKKTIVWLNSLTVKPSVIILYSGYSPYLIRLLPWCKRNKIPLIFDTVEWYDPPSFIKGIFNPYYWNIEFAMRFLLVKTKNIIAISSYLERYYTRKGCKTIRIPPMLDVTMQKHDIDYRSSEKLNLVYAGSPGNKDLLDNVLESVLQLVSEGYSLRLNIAGISKKQLLNFNAIVSRNFVSIPECIVTHGQLNHSDALNLVRKADFSVLLRPVKRYSTAGFPTKIVESLPCGTPVIANVTSDLGNYLKNNNNGLICESQNVQCLKTKLIEAMELEKNTYNTFRINARKTAENHFDFRHFTNALTEFIKT